MGRPKGSHRAAQWATALGGKVREARQMAELSQADLGEMLGGLPQQTIHRYESGKTVIPLPVLVAISHQLRVDFLSLVKASSPESERMLWVDQWSRRSGEMLEGARMLFVTELEAIKEDPGLPVDLKIAYEVAVGRLKNVPQGKVRQDIFIKFVLDLLQTAASLRASQPSKQASFAGREGRRRMEPSTGEVLAPPRRVMYKAIRAHAAEAGIRGDRLTKLILEKYRKSSMRELTAAELHALYLWAVRPRK